MVAALASVLDFQSQSFAQLEYYRTKIENVKKQVFFFFFFFFFNSVLAMMSKEEQQTMKTCFDELYLRFDANQQWDRRICGRG